MARIDIKGTTGGGGGSGTVTSVGLSSSTLTVTNTPVTTSGTIVANIPDGYLKVGTGITGTLQNVVDTNGTATTLFLSSTEAQLTSPLRITTSDASGFYLDAEDSATNNRFSIKRDPSAQEVTLDFASNPAGSTTLVGAIRTYRDGVNLSNAMSFIEDGSIGIGTNAPVGLLHLYKSAAATRLAIDGDAGQNRLISYRTGALQRFGLYVNNTAESGSNAGSNFAIRAYSDAGTLLSTPFFITRSSGNVGINTLTPSQQLHVNGSLRIETGGIYDGTNSIGTSGQVLSSTGTSTAWITPSGGSPAGTTGGVQFNNAGAFGADSTNFFWDDTNNRLGIGTNTPAVRTHILGSGSTTATSSLLIQNSASTNIFQVRDDGNIAIYTSRIFDGVNTEKSFYISGNDTVVSNFRAVSLRVYDGTAYASGLEVVGNGAESRVGIGTTAPNASAKLQLDSTTKGFLPPRMTTAQKNAIATPAAGLIIYDTTLNKLCVRTAAAWETITSA